MHFEIEKLGGCKVKEFQFIDNPESEWHESEYEAIEPVKS